MSRLGFTPLRTPFRCSMIIAAGLLSACAQQPLPFDMVDSGNGTHRGIINPNNKSMQVRIGDKQYQGFYVVATSVASNPQVGVGIGGYGGYRAYGAYPSTTYINSNTAKAHLKTLDGEHLSCDFLFEGKNVVGDCKSPQGSSYQIVASPSPTGK